MSSVEWGYWHTFYRLYPFGWHRDNLLAASIKQGFVGKCSIDELMLKYRTEGDKVAAQDELFAQMDDLAKRSQEE